MKEKNKNKPLNENGETKEATSKKVDELKALRKQHDELIKECEALEERAKKAEAALIARANDYYKALADADNYKKRLDSEQERERKYRYQPLLEKLIDPVDLLAKVVAMPVTDPTLSAYLAGFKMITDRLSDLFTSEGVIRVKTLGLAFDPHTSQAIETKWDENTPEGIVLEEHQAGYLYKDRLLRPAYVVVNTKPEADAKAPSEAARDQCLNKQENDESKKEDE